MIKKHLIIGNPINHSLSPKIHNYWFKKNNINGDYDKKLIENNDDLKKIFEDIKNDDDFYFVHSYHADCDPKFVIAECQYGISITAAIEKENLIAFQFHPEKSHLNGLKLLNNSIKKLWSNSNA